MENFNRIIWTYWHQGFDEAPEIVKKCISTWENNNSSWKIIKLSQSTLINYIDIETEIENFGEKNITLTSLSDIIRIILLHQFGGIWVDSTLFCRMPLDNWMPHFYKNDFWCFSKRKEKRIITSWFLFAKKDSYIISKWHEKTIEFWNNSNSTEEYFWFHKLFFELYLTDSKFKKIWDNTSKIFADKSHYFLPYNLKFFEKNDNTTAQYIEKLKTPVFKLTYKYDQELDKRHTVLEYILNNDLKISRPRILVAWYGSFQNNGTIGDFLSIKSLTDFLFNLNIPFDCACYKYFEGINGNIVDLNEIEAKQYEILFFCCGPIFKTHKNLELLFNKFSCIYKIGIGISLFPKEHINYFNPFNKIFARENGEENFEDIAIISQYRPANKEAKKKGLTIGIVLRNQQQEYGIENCMYENANQLLLKLSEDLLNKKNTSGNKIFRLFQKKGTILIIENHLEKSGLSPSKIINKYLLCDLILTTRYHGAIISIKENIPVIAIDQIENGSKVFNLLSQTGYPFVWKINEVSYEEIKLRAKELLKNKHSNSITLSKNKSVSNSQNTLEKLNEFLISFFYGDFEETKNKSL